ncbi:MAG: endonuclease MutS2 [Firmicutes bacterium]|nr:endonuclease MutS2 [Bacillota bacterium]
MREKTLKVLEYKKILGMLKEKAESSLGKELINELTPNIKKDEIENAQLETEEALTIMIKRGNPPLGGIHDVSKDIKRANLGASLTPKGLLKIADTLRAARNLRNYLKHDKEDKDTKYPLLENMFYNLNIHKNIEKDIEKAIISEEEISDDASPKLKDIRRQKQNKHASIRNKLNSIINSSSKQKYLQESIITIRGDRYVVPVKMEHKAQIPGIVHDQSSSGATIFIEPVAVVELNNQLRELKSEEKNEIERILAVLTEKVNKISEDIKNNQKILSKLDFTFAKGKFALDMKAIKPILNNDGYINIKQGRHPLIEANEVVPIDIYLGKDFTSLVITGPNTGGKTVTLKTVGLLTLMAQSGLHIPANQGSQIAVFDSVFADIGDEQSIEQSLSTFSSHMTNIVDILKSINKNSLVLFDELGAGTDPTEGAALAMAILDHLYNKGIRTLATTHYSELKIYAVTNEGVENASVEFDVETLSPTYRLLIGIPGKSNAFEISKRLGLQEFIINSATRFLSKENIEFEDVLAQIEKDRKISEENREESEKLKSEVKQLKKELTEKKQKINNMKKNTLRQAKEEARSILENAKEEANIIIKELRNMSTEMKKERNKKIQNAKDKLKSELDNVDDSLTEDILSSKNTKPPKNLKKGDTVKILNLDQTGSVLTEPDGDGNLTVQAGIMKINVNVENLKRAKDESESKSQQATKGIIRSKSTSIKTELDLRGKNLEEAIMEVDKYLDDVYIAGLNEVTIIHGKGTGVLRQGIKQLLKSHRHVKSFRLGEFGEGGTGVTIVNLK